MAYFQAWALAFLFTQMGEVPIYAVGLRVGLLPAFGASAITHPVLWFAVFPYLHLPYIWLIAIGESFKIRALLVHAAAGAAMLALGYYGSGFSRASYEESIDHPPPAIARETEIAAAAGAVFGLVYWAIAGRKAGAWRES